VASPRRTARARRRLLLLCGLLPVILSAVLSVSRPPGLARLDDAVYDTLLRSIDARAPSGRIVIVDVDERSLSAVGQWPWRRDVVGRLVSRLRDAGAAVVALDIIFAEPDRDSFSAMPGGTTPDGALAAALAEGKVVLGYAMTFDRDGAGPGTCVLHPVGLPIVHPRQEIGGVPLFRATGAVCSLAPLARAAGASGFLNAAPDADGLLRRVPLLVELGGRVYPSLALASVRAVAGARDLALHVFNVNAAQLVVDGRPIPLDGRGNLLLRYRGGKRTFPYVSAADVLNDRVPAERLRDKIVLVGTTALGTREVVSTPLDTLFAGVEVQATVADNLLQQDFLARAAPGTAVEGQVALGLGFALVLLLTGRGLTAGALGAGVGLGGLWWAAAWLLAERGIFLSPLFPTLAVVLGFLVMVIAKFTVERKRADTAGRERTAAQRLMVQSLLSLTEVRDNETGRHSRRTQEYARVLAAELARHPEYRGYLTPERVDLLSRLAPLHDIGKVGIPDHILQKPDALTEDELVEMRRHPTLGRDVLLKAERRVGIRDDAILSMAKDIVYTHHERWDGTGYPRGLRGTDIPVEGRVMAIVDVYDAAVARSLYRAPMSHDQVVAYIAKGRGTQFDPAVVDAFLAVAPVFHEVSQGELAEV
jgi:adenylate cyclase